jgi:hypothetical protein
MQGSRKPEEQVVLIVRRRDEAEGNAAGGLFGAASKSLTRDVITAISLKTPSIMKDYKGGC